MEEKRQQIFSILFMEMELKDRVFVSLDILPLHSHSCTHTHLQTYHITDKLIHSQVITNIPEIHLLHYPNVLKYWDT